MEHYFLNTHKYLGEIFLECGDYISHHYDGVDAEIVFDVIKDKLPPLLVTVSQIIKEIE